MSNLNRFILLAITLLFTLPLLSINANATPRAMHRFVQKKHLTAERKRIINNIQISNLSFKRIAPQRGIWQGNVRGQGEISLYLNIIENNNKKTRRFIGRIQQSAKDRPTPFTYSSTPPASKKWSWHITAVVKK